MRLLNTRNSSVMRSLAAPVLVCIFLALGCGKSNSNNTDPGLLSGNWQIGLQPGSQAGGTPTESGFLLQTGNSLTGQFLFAGLAQCTGLGSASGILTGNNVEITLNQAGQTLTLTGTAASDGSTMGGTYAVLDAGCGNGTSTGTWTANPVKPVTGTYLATFNSYTLGTYVFNISATQGANTGESIATISGTATSSNAPCGENLAIAGTVGGTAVVVNFLTSEGTAIGQFTGAISTDASTLNGTFDFLAQASGTSCTAGDAGSVTLVQQ